MDYKDKEKLAFESAEKFGFCKTKGEFCTEIYTGFTPFTDGWHEGFDACEIVLEDVLKGKDDDIEYVKYKKSNIAALAKSHAKWNRKERARLEEELAEAREHLKYTVQFIPNNYKESEKTDKILSFLNK